MNFVEYMEKSLGIKTKEVKIERIEDVLDGSDLRLANLYRKMVEPRQCHYNSARAIVELDGVLSDWSVGFCEGYAEVFNGYPIEHCWTSLTNKRTGDVRYVDFTLNDAKDAMLLGEWGNDILDLYDACSNAFIPFRSYWEYRGIDKAKEIVLKHYPNVKFAA